ncbi:MAG TPA: hypothetical protein VED45_01595, partial [Steroidobacteraceae bacterium]|nr:hypothetical protein [Steroidobacteraceae bacterium]
MGELFHRRAGAGRAVSVRRRRTAAAAARRNRTITIGTLIARGAARLSRARVYFGHGTDNARDEAAALVLHALRLPPRGGAALYRRRVAASAQRRVEELLARRISERIPAAYLTGVAWFAGVRLAVDRRVLVPRSPLAELIERRFAPW